MIVIANKVIQSLKQDLQHSISEVPAQMCFYMQFSSLGIPKEKLFDVFLRVLEELPNAYRAQVYLCPDKDIFMMMEGLVERQFLEFVIKVANALQLKDMDQKIEIYTVGKDWDKLMSLCRSKLKSNDTENLKKVGQKKSSKGSVLRFFSQFDQGLLQTLPDRRSKRKDPLVLVVDDDQLSRTLVYSVLNGDFNMNFAKTGNEALTEYLLCAPDVLFLDIGLPDISGHDLLKCLFRLDPDAYIIMFSGRRDKANIVKALEAGAQGFVGKPFTREKMLQYIRRSPFVQGKL